MFEVVVDPDELRERIERRTTWMFDHGLVEEVHVLVQDGLAEPLRALRAIGYDEALEVVSGRLDRSEAEARVNLRTARLAKRQRTWFRHQVSAVRLAGGAIEPRTLADAVMAQMGEGGPRRA